jgi:hypothetical protein
MSVSTEASLRLASSSVFCRRCKWPDCSRTNCLRERSRARIAWVIASGTKLGRTSPWASRSASQAASATSVLRPGTFFTCAALARISTRSPSDSTCQTGLQYTQVGAEVHAARADGHEGHEAGDAEHGEGGEVQGQRPSERIVLRPAEHGAAQHAAGGGAGAERGHHLELAAVQTLPRNRR